MHCACTYVGRYIYIQVIDMHCGKSVVMVLSVTTRVCVCVCECVCVCMCVCVGVCACVCMCVCVLHACVLRIDLHTLI